MDTLTITTADGVALSARWLPAPEPEGVAVVLVHGFTASKDHPEVMAVAEALTAAGYDVLSYDGRGHNQSAGLCTLGDRERLDVEAAVAVARLRAGRVVVVGASMGGIAVLRHAATDPSLAGVVSLSAPALFRFPRTVRALVGAVLSRTRLGRWFARRAMGVRIDPVWSSPPPPAAIVGAITVPVAIVHGSADRIVLPREADLLAERIAAPTLVDRVRGMGHAFDPKAVGAILGAVAWCLGIDAQFAS